ARSFLRRWWREGRVTGDDLRVLLRTWWTHADCPFVGDLQLLLPMFHAGKPVFDASLPHGDGFTIFRGQSRSRPTGISWTMRRETAERFAFDSRYPRREPVILRGYVVREDVLGYFIGREEEEVIVDPTRLTERSEVPPLVPRAATRTA